MCSSFCPLSSLSLIDKGSNQLLPNPMGVERQVYRAAVIPYSLLPNPYCLLPDPCCLLPIPYCLIPIAILVFRKPIHAAQPRPNVRTHTNKLCPIQATFLSLSLGWDRPKRTQAGRYRIRTRLQNLKPNRKCFVSGHDFSGSPRTGPSPWGDLSHAANVPLFFEKQSTRRSRAQSFVPTQTLGAPSKRRSCRCRLGGISPTNPT